MLHIPPTNLLFLAAKQEPYKKPISSRKYWRILWKKFRKKDQKAEKKRRKKDRKSNGTRQKNKRGNSKVESNDSPETPDGGGGRDIRHPRPPKAYLQHVLTRHKRVNIASNITPNDKKLHSQQLVSCWCFESSQPQRITTGLTTNLSLSPS